MSDEKNQEPTPAPSNHEHDKKRKRVMIEAAIAFLVIALIVFLWWWFILRWEVSTDDAYVEGDLININSRQPGVVIAYYADNTDLVEEGQLLVELDPTDYFLRYQEAETWLALQARRVKQLSEQVGEERQNVLMKGAELALAFYDFDNRKPLVDTGAISREEFARFETGLEIAQAAFLMAEYALARVLAELGTTSLDQHPYILQAEEMLREAFLQWKRCRIYSPARGWVAQRNIQVGEYVDVERNMLAVIPLNRVWVTANYKETQLYWLRIGQPVRIKVDMYGGAYTFHGKLKGILGGSGAVFALLPPQNAMGNWIKIVQRVPVRILFEPDEIEQHPIFLGLSCYTTVDISNVDGDVLSPIPDPRLIEATDIYRIPLDPVEKRMEAIVRENLMEGVVLA